VGYRHRWYAEITLLDEHGGPCDLAAWKHAHRTKLSLLPQTFKTRPFTNRFKALGIELKGRLDLFVTSQLSDPHSSSVSVLQAVNARVDDFCDSPSLASFDSYPITTDEELVPALAELNASIEEQPLTHELVKLDKLPYRWRDQTYGEVLNSSPHVNANRIEEFQRLQLREEPQALGEMHPMDKNMFLLEQDELEQAMESSDEELLWSSHADGHGDKYRKTEGRLSHSYNWQRDPTLQEFLQPPSRTLDDD